MTCRYQKSKKNVKIIAFFHLTCIILRYIFSNKKISFFKIFNAPRDYEKATTSRSLEDMDQNESKMPRVFPSSTTLEDESNHLESSIQISNSSDRLQLTIDNLPGIGKVYTTRLNEKNVNVFGDLIHLFNNKCERNVELFSMELKSLAKMRADSINRLVLLIQSYLNESSSEITNTTN